jgi:hypothetical protein
MTVSRSTCSSHEMPEARNAPSAAPNAAWRVARIAYITPAVPRPTPRPISDRFCAALPVVDSVLRDYAQLIAEGHGDEDISAIFRLTERLFD